MKYVLRRVWKLFRVWNLSVWILKCPGGSTPRQTYSPPAAGVYNVVGNPPHHRPTIPSCHRASIPPARSGYCPGNFPRFVRPGRDARECLKTPAGGPSQVAHRGGPLAPPGGPVGVPAPRPAEHTPAAPHTTQITRDTGIFPDIIKYFVHFVCSVWHNAQSRIKTCNQTKYKLKISILLTSYFNIFLYFNIFFII